MKSYLSYINSQNSSECNKHEMVEGKGYSEFVSNPTAFKRLMYRKLNSVRQAKSQQAMLLIIAEITVITGVALFELIYRRFK